MKFLRKMILAICAVGILGLAGFAAEAHAKVSLNVSVDGDMVTVALPEDTDRVEYKFGSIERVYLGDDQVKTFNEGDSWDAFELSISDIRDKLDDGRYDKIKVVIEDLVINELDGEGEVKSTKTEDVEGEVSLNKPLFKQTITKRGTGTVKVSFDGDAYEDEYEEVSSFYAYKGDRFYLSTEPGAGYVFGYFSGGNVEKRDGFDYDDEDSIEYFQSIAEGATTYTATFTTEASGISLKATSGSKSSTSSITVTEGDVIRFDWFFTPDGGTYKGNVSLDYSSEYFDRKSDTELKAKKATTSSSPVRVRVKLNPDTLDINNSITVTINEKPYNPSSFTIKADQDYLTEGYSLLLTPDFSVTGNIYDPIVWELEGEGTLTGLGMGYSGKTVKDYIGVEVKATTGKVESGKTGTIKVTATLPDGNGKGYPATAEKSITIYPKNSISYSDSNKNLSFTSPSKVNTGTTSGVDNDDKDTTKTAISDVKGIKLHLYSGDKFLGMTAVAKDKGTSGTIDSSTVAKMTGSVSTGLSGDSAELKVRALPCDSDGKYNKKVYSETRFTVYRVVVTFTKADGTTADYITYRPEGYKLNVADAIAEVVKSSDGKVTEVDGTTDTTVTVGTSAAQNKHTAVLGASRANAGAANGGANASARADDSGLDKVPKTGQDNTVVFLMIVLVVCAVGSGLYAYNRKAKKAQ